MRIAICDDSLLELENTKKLVSSYYQKIQVNVEISCFDNPANLIKLINLPNSTGFDLHKTKSNYRELFPYCGGDVPVC